MQIKAIKKRNNQNYKKHLKGITSTELAGEHNLSTERIRQICNRLKVQLSKKIASTYKPTKIDWREKLPFN